MTIATILAEGEVLNGRFLPSDMKEFWWSTAAFCVVMFGLITKVLPIAKAGLNERSEAIRAQMEESDELASSVAAPDAANEAGEDAEVEDEVDVQAEADAIVAKAKADAETMKADLIARANAEAEQVVAKVATESEASSGQAAADVQNVVATQAYSATEAAVMASLDDATQNELIDAFIEQVSAS